MNTSIVQNRVCKSITGMGIRRRLFDLIPNMTVNGGSKVNNWGVILSRPDVNRGIMGVTALLTQPYIDYHNHKVDQETASVATCRTIAKIIAGTTVGCAVRSACYYLVNACTSASPKAPKWKRWLMPNPNVERYIRRRNVDWFKNYKNTLATIIGLSAMLFTNVLLDVPLTTYLSKKLLKKHEEKNNNQTQKTEITNPTVTPVKTPNTYTQEPPRPIQNPFLKPGFPRKEVKA